MAAVKKILRTLLDSKVQIVGDHFAIKRKQENLLGEGGFGVVWRAVDERKNEAVAVKTIKRNPETEIFCERELRCMRECQHQNVIQLLEFVADDSSFYFVLELCEGNLDEFVKDKDIALPAIFDYMTNICSGIKCLHDKGIAHRDVKPENVLVKDNVLKVSDLGLAKEFFDSTSGQSATGGIGTFAWMAPELCTDERKPNYGLAVDIFSLALLFLSLLTHVCGEHLTAHKGMHITFLVLVMVYCNT